MGFWTRLLRGEKAIPFDTYDAAQRVLPAPHEPFMGHFYGSGIPVADPGIPLVEYGRARVEALWRTQPNVRKVVDFIARNVASIPLHTFERASDTDRQRLTEHPLADVIARPARGVAPFRFWHSVISDGLLYDRWAVLKQPTESGMELVQVPSWRLRFVVDGLRRVVEVWFYVGDSTDRRESDRDGWRQLDMDTLIFDHGYAPASAGLSPMETLADVLAETTEAVKYRKQVWENGARVPQYVYRPTSAPPWSAEARDRWAQGFRDSYVSDGPKAGGVPLMEDGMEIRSADAFKPVDTQDLEGRRLSSIEVASAFHIAPELVGAREGTYSNVDAFRQMLYRDSLGPYITAWEGALNAQLVPDLAAGRRLYVEANVDAKLRGSFQEQAQVMQSATGAPWLTRNEARALQNRPPVDGGDELVVPLNVLVGGQASPRDGVTAGGGGGKIEVVAPEVTEQATVGGFTPDEIVQLVNAAAALIRSGFDPAGALAAVGLDPIEHLGLLPVTVQRPQEPENVDQEVADALKAVGRIRLKARAPETYQKRVRQVLESFFNRQGSSVRSALGGKADADWWDGERWDRELTDDLHRLALLVSEQVAKSTLERLGVSPDEYDTDRTLAFLRAVSERIAGSINTTTRVQIEQALANAEDDDRAAAVARVFDVASESRSEQSALTAVTTFSAFGTTEAAQQASGGNATKTWVTTSANPRSSHAAMNGETVGISEQFSNGASWPGDALNLDVDDIAGCQCDIVINLP